MFVSVNAPGESGYFLLCGEDIANEDFLDVGGLDASALNGSCMTC
jgi:hypothetical protein